MMIMDLLSSCFSCPLPFSSSFRSSPCFFCCIFFSTSEFILIEVMVKGKSKEINFDKKVYRPGKLRKVVEFYCLYKKIIAKSQNAGVKLCGTFFFFFITKVLGQLPKIFCLK